MTVKPRVYLYPDEELKAKIEKSAKKHSLSVSSWLKLAAVEKLKREDKSNEKTTSVTFPASTM